MDTGEFRFNDEGILFYFGAPTMLLNINTLMSLQKELEEKDVAKESLKKVGAQQARRALERYEDRYNFDQASHQEIMSFVDDLTDVLALGEFETMQVDDEEGIKFAVENRSNPLARVYRKEYGEAESPKDHFLKGLIGEAMNIINGTELEVEERECMAKGDERCLFLLKTRD